nr:unnamed protein product [Spirometra erinaceieuropaei]
MDPHLLTLLLQLAGEEDGPTMTVGTALAFRQETLFQMVVQAVKEKTGRVSPLTLAAWNFRSLLNNPRSNRPEWRTALVARELARYKVDIAALSETRFFEQGQLEEVGAGYTFFWSGRPRAERRDAGVAFTIRNDIVGRLPCLPQDINDPPASPGRQIRHHHQRLRSDDDQPRRRQRQILRGPARPLGDCVEGGQVDCPWRLQRPRRHRPYCLERRAGSPRSPRLKRQWSAASSHLRRTPPHPDEHLLLSAGAREGHLEASSVAPVAPAGLRPRPEARSEGRAGDKGDRGSCADEETVVSDSAVRNLRRRNSHYGLPKVHKDGAPLRPIVSLQGTPTYGLAKWLFRRLKFLTAESDTTVSSSAQFLEKIKGDLAIETIELLLQSKYDETDNRLGHAQILQLLQLCLRTYFTFDGTIYEQVKGTTMGSPIPGFIAEAVLQRVESLVFQYHRPKFWARYVDDTFVVIERDQVLTFQEHLSAVFPDIQFTMEEEENNQLAFLDALVCRKDCGELKTKVLRKATNTMQVLNFNSNHPISHKRSCVRTLYRRVETHCSEPDDKIAELQYLRRTFKANGYSRNFFDRCIRKRDERPNCTDTKSWRALPYVKNVSEAVGRLLAPLGVGVAHRPEATIRRLVMKPKDPLPRLETSGVVYRIWCSCGRSNYVGETGRQLLTRMAEHAAVVRRNDASSQVAAHWTRSGHTFKFDEAEILARGDNRVSRQLLESWFTGPQSINKCNNLPILYSVLKLRLGGVTSHAGSAEVNTFPNTGVGPSDGRAIITPTSNARDEIAAIIDSNIGHQAMITPSATILDEGGSRECS